MVAGVDGARTEKARSALLIVLCQALVQLGVVHTSSPTFPYPTKMVPEDGMDKSSEFQTF